jgi:outer membrane protein assembly factor BamB
MLEDRNLLSCGTLWRATYDDPFQGGATGRRLVLDPSGNVYVAGTACTGLSCDEFGCGCAGAGFLTAKYDSAGTLLWAQTYTDGVGLDMPNAIAVDATGNVYVTGESQGATFDYVTLKYAPDGTQLWERRYDGPGHGYDSARALTIDSAGNVIVTGTSKGTSGVLDIATIKYDPEGNTLWVNRKGTVFGGQRR